MKKGLFFVVLFTALSTMPAMAQMQMEMLNRGLVAIRQGQGYFLQWRLLGNEPYNTSFNVYRGTTRLNSSPITNVTSYIDANAPINSQYTVRAIINGVEQAPSENARIINSRQGENAGYFDIELQRPAVGTHGGSYSPGDASVGDLTGDGEYEIVIKWDPSNARDNSQTGHTDRVFLDAYTLDGERLWRIDLGVNIRAGAHYTQFLVFDFDGDGRSEIMVKTAPGTRDGTGRFIAAGPAANADHSRDYRESRGLILEGPEYLTVFDGRTGAELATADYWPPRGRLADWGDNWGNRADRFNATVAYLDGQRPSAVFQRGYYTRMTLAAWDWRNGQLTRRWTFDSNDPQHRNYRGQGNHSIHVIDANNDGRHDIVTGSAVIGSDGRGMHATGRGHGDATHVTHMIKNSPYPQIFLPYEGGNGVSLRHANSGVTIFHHSAAGDIGRGCAAELDPQRPGFHFWASGGLGLFDISGTRVGNVPSSINFVIWWDGNLSRELMNGNTITRWSIANNRGTNLLTGTGASSINGTKSTPVLQADLFGDWREEVILRRDDNNAVRVYITTMPTNRKLFTFMHDPTYRVAISWQQASYNQPPHPGFYVASDMDFPPPTPNIYIVGATGVVPPPPPPPAVTRVFRGNGNLFDSLYVYETANAQNWNVMTNMATGQNVYGDRAFTIETIPQGFEGSEWIQTAMNSRTVTNLNQYATIVARGSGVIYIAHCDRVTTKPQWLSAYTQTDMAIIIRENATTTRRLTLFSREFSQGDTIAFGINSTTGTTTSSMYIPIVRALPVTNISQAETEVKELAISVSPNPFNPATVISYALPTASFVELKIFNINGALVEELVSGNKGVGVHTVSFDGARLPSGVYFARMSANGKMLQKKMLLLK